MELRKRQFIWTIKSRMVRQSAKALRELSEKEDLFDEASIDKKSKIYQKTAEDFEMARKMGCSVVTYLDDLYPEKLRNISQPPPVLFVWGNPTLLSNTVFAGIVGARKCDDYAIRVSENFAMEIGQTGAGIVSGGALGVDAASHRGALRAKAPTVAVLGSGIDIAYPPENHGLFSAIVKEGGSVISEFSFGEPANGNNFPRRNRIIAALSDVLIVTRAGKRSGSLITASQAMDMNKTVYAVPGNIDQKLSQGTNELIRDGAVPLLNAIDVIDELISINPDFFVREEEAGRTIYEDERYIEEPEKKNVSVQGLSEYEAEIVNIIESGADTQNLIEERISFDPSRLTALIQMMEIKGIIKKGRGNKYAIK
ncbi:MAG: DNA-processing protein DprA [Clostridia bacterium]|nr:DNA-processing protein DprA [Clostridia bacterium]